MAGVSRLPWPRESAGRVLERGPVCWLGRLRVLPRMPPRQRRGCCLLSHAKTASIAATTVTASSATIAFVAATATSFSCPCLSVAACGAHPVASAAGLCLLAAWCTTL